ncbi:MAG TPA: FAD-dependent monooxygenase [Candidatus Limnocylindria bacterium]|nr:FAD-dependent monooxygenase [Candidatus Limnocylindria bacterium]
MTGVAVVGAGPVGLTLAGRLAQHGVEVALFDAAPGHVGEGSKALCMQRETLEIWDRLGIGERVAERGIQWHVGRTYFRERELFSITLPATTDDHFPPFVNISQTEVEAMLLARLAELGVTVQWGRRVVGVEQDGEGVTLAFEDGSHQRAAYAVGTDGAHSGVRHAIGLSFDGYSFDDRFLITDVRARLPFPRERRFFFDPPWNPGRQMLIHPQPDDGWRIDWQVPAETDPDAEVASGRLDARIRAVIGPDVPYELVWMTAYRFSQRLADRFRVGRVFLAGDAAHVFSPFGARGLNSGAADAENLAWKLAAVLRGEGSDALLDSYDAERRTAARENLAVTEATMRFMVPHGPLRRAWREVILRLSEHVAWARRRVNSGRLAQPATYAASRFVGEPAADPRLPRPGSVLVDVRLSDGRRLRELTGRGFVALVPRGAAPALPGVTVLTDPALARPYAPAPESESDPEPEPEPRAWLIRPDAHIAATGRPEELPVMLARALGRARVA